MINEVFEQRNTLLYHAELQRQIFLTVCHTIKQRWWDSNPRQTGYDHVLHYGSRSCFGLLIRGTARAEVRMVVEKLLEV